MQIPQAAIDGHVGLDVEGFRLNDDAELVAALGAVQHLDRQDRAIRRVHPSGEFEEPLLDRFDEHLGSDRLTFLLRQVRAVPSATADLELPTTPAERSCTLYVGVEGAPRWACFNRELLGRQRLIALRSYGGEIAFWIIMISRVGPFWMSYWNRFQEHGGEVVPEVATELPWSPWPRITNGIRAVLTQFGLREVDTAVLDTPIYWMSTAVGYLLEQRGRSPLPTVYHSLFGDI